MNDVINQYYEAMSTLAKKVEVKYDLVTSSAPDMFKTNEEEINFRAALRKLSEYSRDLHAACRKIELGHHNKDKKEVLQVCRDLRFDKYKSLTEALKLANISENM